jgi:hypothetical protein
MPKLICYSRKKENSIERIPLNCQNVPDIIRIVEKQTNKKYKKK